MFSALSFQGEEGMRSIFYRM